MKILFSIILGLIPVGQIHAEVWDPANAPSLFDLDHRYEYDFSKLPTQATLKTIPWSETYWPSYRGSINLRWYAPEPDGFNYTPPTLEQVKVMSLEQLKTLSPSEKYDLFMGHYDYPLWHEVSRYANPHAGEFTGLCDGWSIAAIQYREPDAVTVANPDGILIPFGASDVKALMTFASEFHSRRQTVQVGTSCQANCTGMNAGALHVILSNQIGIMNQGFVTERQVIDEQWNQPVYAYESKEVGSAPSNVAGAHGVLMHTVLHYTEDLDLSYYEPVSGTNRFHSNKVAMDYVLDLNDQNQIVGGTYLPNSDRVGYFWMQTNALKFTGTMSGIQQIYREIPLP
jgi:hypothetical protein